MLWLYCWVECEIEIGNKDKNAKKKKKMNKCRGDKMSEEEEQWNK